MCVQVFCWLADWGQPGSWSQWNVLYLSVFHWNMSEISHEPQSMYLLQALKKKHNQTVLFVVVVIVVQKWGGGGLGCAKVFCCKASNSCHFWLGILILPCSFMISKFCIHSTEGQCQNSIGTLLKLKSATKHSTPCHLLCHWVNSNTCSQLQGFKGDSYLAKLILSFTLHYPYISTTNSLFFMHYLQSL